MPLGAPFNDPNRMALMALGSRMMQAAQPTYDPRTRGMGAAMSGFMSDLPGIQNAAMQAQKEKRLQEQHKWEVEQREKAKDREAKTREALQKHKDKSGGKVNYQSLASELLVDNPELAFKLLDAAPKPLRGKNRYQVTQQGLLDLGGSTPRIVPGTENIKSTSQSPAIIQETNAVFERMKAIEPGADPNELWMKAYKTATSRASLTPQQEAAEFYSTTLQKLISDEMSVEEIQDAQKAARKLTDDFKARHLGSSKRSGPPGAAPTGLGSQKLGGLGSGMGRPAPTPQPAPSLMNRLGSAIGLSRPATAAEAPMNSVIANARSGEPARPAPAPASREKKPSGPTGTDYYNFLKQRYPDRDDTLIRARVQQKYPGWTG